jgi:hypothetical protein
MPITREMHLAWTWMTEKYFAATPFACRNTILVLHIIIQISD